MYTNRLLKTMKFTFTIPLKFSPLQRDKRQSAKWLKESFIDMGPTYVKIGQIMSTRVDIFKPYIIEELKELQDNIKPYEFGIFEDMFISDFGNFDNYFTDINTNPLACASIGQIYAAKMKNGKHVVIKAQKPNIREIFDQDLYIINQFIEIAETINDKNINDIIIILKETTKSINEELNFDIEKKNLLIYQTICKEKEFIVPRVYTKLSNERILTMEYVPGTKITTNIGANESDVNIIIEKLLYNFVLIFIQFGYIHCDPHPGNLSLDKDFNIILYDYGIVTKIDDKIRTGCKKTLFSIYDNDILSTMSILIEYNILYPTTSYSTSIDRLTNYEYIVLYKFILYVLEYTRHCDINKIVHDIKTDELIDLDNIPFVFDNQIILMFKTMTTLEGVCKTLNHEFSYTDYINRLIPRILGTDMFFEITSKIFSSQNIVKNKMDKERIMNYKIEKIQKNIEIKFAQSMLVLFLFYFFNFQ